MARKVFTQEQLQSLNANPYTLNATPNRFMLTKEAKEKILAMAEGGMSISHIIRELGTILTCLDVIGYSCAFFPL